MRPTPACYTPRPKILTEPEPPRPIVSVDLYAPCPCGSGKKIKFCKCKDSVHEMDQVLQMVEGGQVVPAMDRMKAILEKDPQAAWVLAIRGRLLMDLREYDSLAENADRFISLQPNNPTALAQRGAAKIFAGDVDEATESLLQALTESGQSVDSFVLDIASVLAYTLFRGGNYLSARVYATLAMVADGYEGGQTALQVLRGMNSSPQISLYLKGIPDPPPRPDGVEWAERFDEAATLLRSNQVLTAQSKFESLRRTAQGQPAVIGGLLTCAIWRGDVDQQASLLEQMADCETLSDDDRMRYRVMSLVVQPGAKPIADDVPTLTADITSADELVMAMTADDRCVQLPNELTQQFRAKEDDVPPKAVFEFGDRPKPMITDGLPPTDQIPMAIGVGLVYGKQTDREARLEIIPSRSAAVEPIREILSKVDDKLSLTQTDTAPVPLVSLAAPHAVAIQVRASQADVQKMQTDLVRERAPGIITTTAVPALKGKTLADASGDDSMTAARTAIVRAVESFDALASIPGLMDAVRDAANVPAPETIRPTAEQVDTLDNVDLPRVDASNLDIESQQYLLQRCEQLRITTAARTLSRLILDRELDATAAGDDAAVDAKIAAYMSAIQTVESDAEAMTLIEAAKSFADEHKVDHPPLRFTEMSLRLSAGDAEGFQRAVEDISTRYRNDQQIMMQLQQFLVRVGLLRPDGTPATGPPPGAMAGGPGAMPGSAMQPAAMGGPAAAPAPGGGSGLWTPDQGSPSGGGGGGKIILPD